MSDNRLQINSKLYNFGSFIYIYISELHISKNLLLLKHASSVKQINVSLYWSPTQAFANLI